MVNTDHSEAIADPGWTTTGAEESRTETPPPTMMGESCIDSMYERMPDPKVQASPGGIAPMGLEFDIFKSVTPIKDQKEQEMRDDRGEDHHTQQHRQHVNIQPKLNYPAKIQNGT